MGIQGITLKIDDELMIRLTQEAYREFRHPKEHAVVILRQALGLSVPLPSDDEDHATAGQSAGERIAA